MNTKKRTFSNNNELKKRWKMRKEKLSYLNSKKLFEVITVNCKLKSKNKEPFLDYLKIK